MTGPNDDDDNNSGSSFEFDVDSLFDIPEETFSDDGQDNAKE